MNLNRVELQSQRSPPSGKWNDFIMPEVTSCPPSPRPPTGSSSPALGVQFALTFDIRALILVVAVLTLLYKLNR